MGHPEVEGNLPLLALDALEPWEELAVRAHVEGCEECACLLAEFVEAAAHLAGMVPPVEPPAELTRRIFEEVSGVRALPVRSRASARAGSPRGRSLAALVAAAAMFVPGVVAFGYHRLELSRVSEARGRAALAQVLDDPAHRTFDLAPTGASRASGRVLASDDVAAVVVHGLDAPGSRIYVVWAVDGDAPRSLAEFRPDGTGSATVRVPLGAGTPVAVTLEDAAGHDRPLGTMVLSG